MISHWALDDGSGLIASDSVGSNPGVLAPQNLNVGSGIWDYTAPDWVSGKFGGALAFSGGTYPGPGDMVRIPNTASLNAPSFTVSTWVNTLQTSDYAGYVTKGWGSNIGDSGGWVLDYTSGVRASVQTDAGVHQPTSAPGTPIANSQWHSAVMTYHQGILSLYVDGALSKTRSASYGATVKDVTFGGDGYGTLLLDGRLDDIGYWNNALSAAEANSLYTVANHVELGYTLKQADDLFQVHRAYEGSTVVGSRTWHASGSLGSGLGEIVQSGSDFSIRLDNRGNGVTTGTPSPTDPPPSPEYAPISNPDTILNDWPASSQVNWPQYIEPIQPADYDRYQGPAHVDTPGGDLVVRAWNYMPSVPDHGTAGIVETQNVLRSDQTAVILVHPWGIEDGQGWEGPQAYNLHGYAFCGLLEDNLLANDQFSDLSKPFVDSMRGRLPMVAYSEPVSPDSTRQKLYRDYDSQPSAADRVQGQQELEAYLNSLEGNEWPSKIPVHSYLDYAPNDVVIYDGLGYGQLSAFLQAHGIQNVLLGGYCTDMCVISTTAGYQNLVQEFNVFLVGDVTLAAWPTTPDPPNGYNPIPTTDALITASQQSGAHPMAITQSSWIQLLDPDPGTANAPSWRGEDNSILAQWNNWQARDADDPQRQFRRTPDYWEFNSATPPPGDPPYADQFDSGLVELVGTYAGRVNVAEVTAGEELVLHLPDPLAGDLYDELHLQVTWRPLTGQDLLAEFEFHSGEASQAFSFLDRVSEENGWVTDILSALIAPEADMALISLAFSTGAGYVDQVVLDAIGASLAGDLDGDGFVGGADLDIIRSFWGQTVTAGNKLHGDPSGDGFVGGDDLDEVRANWGEGTPPESKAVPEPSLGLIGLQLYALAMTVGARRWRRQR